MIEPGFNDALELMDSIDFCEGKKTYFDPMIKAAFLMAPAYGFVFDEGGLSHIKTPLYIVSGARDEMVPVVENAQYFAKWISTSVLNIIPGKVGHYIFLGEPSAIGKKLLTPKLYADDASVNRHQIHKNIEEQAYHFFTKNLNNKNDERS